MADGIDGVWYSTKVLRLLECVGPNPWKTRCGLKARGKPIKRGLHITIRDGYHPYP